MKKRTTIILIIVALVLGAAVSGGYYFYTNFFATEDSANEIKPIEEKTPDVYRKDFSEGEICGYIRKQKNIDKVFTCSDPQKATPTEDPYKGKEIWDVLYSKEDSDDPKDTFSYIIEVETGKIVEGPLYAEPNNTEETSQTGE